jgi:hypothetical protein
MRRHAQESGPVFQQGRRMSAFCPPSPHKSARSIGALSCPVAIEHVSLAWRNYARCRRRLAAIVLDGAASALLMLTIGVGAGFPSRALSTQIDLAHQQIGSPPQNFEFWRAGQADLGHRKVVREASADNDVSIQQSGADRAARPSLVIYAPVLAVNARVRARFKLIDGSMPSAGIFPDETLRARRNHRWRA